MKFTPRGGGVQVLLQPRDDDTSRSPSATRAAASAGSSCRTCSTDSARRTRRPRVSFGGLGLGLGHRPPPRRAARRHGLGEQPWRRQGRDIRRDAPDGRSRTGGQGRWHPSPPRFRDEPRCVWRAARRARAWWSKTMRIRAGCSNGCCATRRRGEVRLLRRRGLRRLHAEPAGRARQRHWHARRGRLQPAPSHPRRARGNGRASIPAIALTALARAEDRRRALLAGYQMHLAKPVEPAELRIAIAELLRRGPVNA